MITILNKIFPDDISRIIFDYIKVYKLDIIMQAKLLNLELHLDTFAFPFYQTSYHNFTHIKNDIYDIYSILYFADKHNYKFDPYIQYYINNFKKVIMYQIKHQNNIIKKIFNKILKLNILKN